MIECQIGYTAINDSNFKIKCARNEYFVGFVEYNHKLYGQSISFQWKANGNSSGSLYVGAVGELVIEHGNDKRHAVLSAQVRAKHWFA